MREALVATATFVLCLVLSGGCFTAAQMAQLQTPTDNAKSPTFDTRATWRTAVSPPSGPGTGVAPNPGLCDYAGMALMKTGRFTVVGRSVVDKLLEEQEFSCSGVSDAGTAARLGKMLGAEAVMTINVTRVRHDDFFDDSPDQRDASMVAKIIAVETGEALYSATGEGADFEGEEGALRSALEVALNPLKTQ